MNCDLAKTELIAYLKGELSEKAKEHLEEHFAQCPPCREELEKARKVLVWTKAASEEAIIEEVDRIHAEALKSSASDIHFEPQRDDSLVVRYRIDGVLHEAAHIPPVNRQAVTVRLKMLAGMNVEESRIAQDGRIRWEHEGRKYDSRVSSCPFLFGEGLVLRIQELSDTLPSLDRLGFSDYQLATLRHLMHQPNGVIIASGPTGSGKTTTLYSMLQEIKSPELKIMTIEDPVEYVFEGVNQSQVKKNAGYTFATALRSFLRHDPDVIMAGEIKDQETAVLEIEAALTGHLVLTTLHTNDAIGALIRLVDMGVEPYLIGATLIGVVGQRLVRKVCKSCKKEVELDPDHPVAKSLGINADDLKSHTVYRGGGCPACRHAGYKGRIGVYEVLAVDRELASLLYERASYADMLDAAQANGFLTMRDNAKHKVLDGVTSPEEALRVLA